MSLAACPHQWACLFTLRARGHFWWRNMIFGRVLLRWTRWKKSRIRSVTPRRSRWCAWPLLRRCVRPDRAYPRHL